MKTTNYAETSIIVQVFTEQFGMQSYIVKGAKKPKANIRASLFQPLNLLDMVVYYKQHAGIQQIREVKNYPFYETIPYDITKSTVLLFLNEIVYKSIRTHSPDEQLFEFIYHSLELLDQHRVAVANYSIWFMIRLTRYLGFLPDRKNSGWRYFDLQEGVFVQLPPLHPHYMAEEEKEIFLAFLDVTLLNLSDIVLNAGQRAKLINQLIKYYSFHVDGFGEIKSLEVLHEVLH